MYPSIKKDEKQQNKMIKFCKFCSLVSGLIYNNNSSVPIYNNNIIHICTIQINDNITMINIIVM